MEHLKLDRTCKAKLRTKLGPLGPNPYAEPRQTPDDSGAGGFLTFPERVGIHMPLVGKPERTGAGVFDYYFARFGDFVQRWLYFEVLREVFGDSLNDEDFVDPAENYITTACLPRYLEEWKNREIEAKKEDHHDQILRLVRIQQSLDRARFFVSRYCTAEEEDDEVEEHRNNSEWAVDEQVSLSIIVLGETLTRANIQIQEAVGFRVHGWHNHDTASQGWGYSKVALDTLTLYRWCPRKVAMLRSLFKRNTIGLLFASTDKSYSGSHKRCTRLRCFASEVDHAVNELLIKNRSGLSSNEQTSQIDAFGSAHPPYPFEHDPTCQRQCERVGVDSRELADFIRRGAIPLLQLLPGPQVKVVEMVKWDKPYVIFSHVWSDGYGNPQANTMHKCVLKYFALLFDEIKFDTNPIYRMTARPQPRAASMSHPTLGSAGPTRPSMYFWIDTLAIPVDEEFRPERRALIARMHEIYTHSNHTIVLDNRLMRFDAEKDYGGRAMQIMMSRWMVRLWTLQEAVLSRSLYFNFKDCLYSLDALEATFEEEDLSLHNNIPSIARAYYHGILGTDRYRLRHPDMKKQRYTTNADLVARVWMAAQWRTTTHPEHETLALATLLNVSTDDFANATHRTSAQINQELGIQATESQVPVGSSQQAPDRNGVEDGEHQRALDARMRNLLRCLADLSTSAIPAGMIFLPGPRLPDLGFGWAPRTWLSSQEVLSPDPLSLQLPKTRLLPGGLEVQFPGFVLYELERNNRQHEFYLPEFYFPIDSKLNEWYRCRVKGEPEDIKKRNSMDTRKLAIIAMQYPLVSEKEIALLVLIKKKTPRYIEAAILARTLLQKETRPEVIKERQKAFRERRFSMTLLGERLPKTQQWCVDGPASSDLPNLADLPQFGHERRGTM